MTLLNSERPLDILDILFAFAIILIMALKLRRNIDDSFFKMKLLADLRNHVCVLSL